MLPHLDELRLDDIKPSVRHRLLNQHLHFMRIILFVLSRLGNKKMTGSGGPAQHRCDLNPKILEMRRAFLFVFDLNKGDQADLMLLRKGLQVMEHSDSTPMKA